MNRLTRFLFSLAILPSLLMPSCDYLPTPMDAGVDMIEDIDQCVACSQTINTPHCVVSACYCHDGTCCCTAPN